MSLLQVKMPPMMEIITAEQLMEYLGKCFWLLNILHQSKLMPYHCSEKKNIVLFITLNPVSSLNHHVLCFKKSHVIACL